ncbi:hypothetical protein B9H02_05545 [Prosthecochloris sp. HL-130-GSB]|uniref:DUF2141 domain-containing protein n=2 Tax=Prosthecochloris TaxID=1101 RepID=A0A831ST47_PROAE|nr:hypothetical protein B9H02_05545 [Prosthecochloris sp. HL-130-GSB]MBO8092592.1 DUF2141 domain-containing protein [Prosthecochloris sp.]HED31324.1 DUF2141 domain-containing protein [Prosthecochloris aestuarii]
MHMPLTFNDKAAGSCSWGETGRITINIENLRNDEGFLGVALFRSGDGFPEKSDQAFALTGIKLDESTRQIVLPGIPFGTYAVCVLHDENSNMKMDKNWIGIPKEGFGTSNNPKISMGPPDFDESNFVLDSDDISLIIDMKYF